MARFDTASGMSRRKTSAAAAVDLSTAFGLNIANDPAAAIATALGLAGG